MMMGCFKQDPRLRQDESLKKRPRAATMALQSSGTQAPIVLLYTPLLGSFLTVVLDSCPRSHHPVCRPVSGKFPKEQEEARSARVTYHRSELGFRNRMLQAMRSAKCSCVRRGVLRTRTASPTCHPTPLSTSEDYLQGEGELWW